MLEEVQKCPVCSGTVFKNFLTTLDYSVSHETFKLVQCNSCKLIATSPRPEHSNIGKYYESPKYISHNSKSRSIQDIVYKMVRKITIRSKISLIENKTKRGTILDIGCGTGSLIQALNKRGWKTFGVEPSNIAASQIAPEIQVVPHLQDLKLKADVITLWHVLEHVHNLSETMEQIKERLTTHGTLYIAVPNIESYDSKHYHEYWAALDVPRHLWHFTRQTMTQLLHTHGFKKISIRTMPWDSYYVSLLSEQYKSPNKPYLLRAISALGTGIASNKRGGKNNTSSILYIAQQ
jgi:SAM-dependent methyltransferase